MIENVFKGAIPQPEDARDLAAEPALSGAAPINWSQEFRLPDPGNEDQGTSNSCVAQAFSYYHTQIHAANYSRRDLYSRIALPQGGAYLRDGAAGIVNSGQATRDELADPDPETEPGMRAGAATAQQEAGHQELSYAAITNNSIDSIAQAVRDFKGVVFGVVGSNPGWADMVNPRPPQPGEATWGHALYLMGYHTHSDGQKCLIAKSSWCKTYAPGATQPVTEHHIRENYLTSSNTFNAWTLIPKVQKIKIRKIGWNDAEKGEYFPADTMARLQELVADFNILFPDYELDPTEYNLGKRPWQ